MTRGGQRRGWTRLGLLAGVISTVAACGTPPPVRTAEGEGAGPASVASVPPGLRRTILPGKAVTPEDLSGAAPAKVRSLLGMPGLTRREPPAEVWQYVASACVIDVIFYPPDEGGSRGVGLHAAHLVSRDLEGDALAPAACLDRLAADAMAANP